jgi:hypothetical protein
MDESKLRPESFRPSAWATMRRPVSLENGAHALLQLSAFRPIYHGDEVREPKDGAENVGATLPVLAFRAVVLDREQSGANNEDKLPGQR